MNLPDLPPNTVAAFAGLCGGTVVITKKPDQKLGALSWTCLGCGDYSVSFDSDHKVIDQANYHAGRCRAVPLPTA